jgi:chromosome segregation ATPase
MKYLDNFLDFVGRNKTPITVILGFILIFLVYNTGCNGKYKKEIKALEKEIAIVQDQFDEAVNEKERLRDSSIAYENAANEFAHQADAFKAKAEKERKAKEAALAALRNLPKDVIDTFFITRYAAVPKSEIGLEIDKNVGNEIVIELTEKDHLVGELATSKQENSALTNQVGSLEKSLLFSKAALTSADSAIALKSKQFEMSQQVNEYLKKDLKASQKKAFWNKWKGVGVGIAAGVTAGLLLK